VPALREASGLRFTIHQLRHTFATLMMEGGCDIYSLSRMMGHSDIKTTTIYLSASADHLRAQIGKHPLNDAVLEPPSAHRTAWSPLPTGRRDIRDLAAHR